MVRKIIYGSLAVVLIVVLALSGLMLNVHQDSTGQIKTTITVGEPIEASGITPDYIGTNSATVQQALNALPAGGGEIDLISPAYTFTETVSVAKNNVTIKGSNNTVITYAGACFNVGAQTGWKFEDLSIAVGGTITNYTSALLVNVSIGTDHIEYQTPSTSTASDFVVPVGRTATYVIATSDATATEKAQADVVCDGTADDVEIRNAIVSGITNIHLSSGTFNISASIEMVNYLNIKGSGMKVTYLNLIDGANCNIFQYTGSDYIYFVTFSDLEMFGNYLNNTAGTGIDANTKVADGLIYNCFFDFFKEEGVYIGYSWNWRITDCIFEHCQKYAMDGGNEIIGTKFIYNVQGPIRGQRYTSCYFFQNDQYGLTAPLQVSNCKFEDNSKPSDNYGDILITAGTTPVINGNIFVGGVHSTYGIYLNTGATAIVTNNQFSGHAWFEVYKHASVGYCHISGNKGYIDRGEIRTYSGSIATLTENAFNSVDNPFGQSFRVLSLDINVSTGATSTSPNIDCGIGSSATTDYTTLFDDLPGETVGFYTSTITTPGAQTVPQLWASGSGNRYLNMSIKDAAATGMVATYTVTVMGN